MNLLAHDLELRAPTPSSPHALFETATGYSIILNLLGIERKDIGIRIDETKNEIAVLAKRDAPNATRGLFWVFGIPPEAKLHQASARYKSGVLEITIPKRGLGSVA